MCIRDRHNIGSVFRTSDAFRIECIYLCGITATPPHPEMHKTALGAEFTVNWKYVNNAVEVVEMCIRDRYISFHNILIWSFKRLLIFINKKSTPTNHYIL